MIEYKVIQSARKTLSLQVKHGQVIVRAPYCVEEGFIRAFIQKKSAWLNAKITEQNKTNNCCNFTQGSKLFLFGQLVTLNITFAKKAQTVLTGNIKHEQELTIVLAERNQKKFSDKYLLAKAVKSQIENYLKRQAEEIIPSKVKVFSELTSLTPTSIKIRQYRSRWGSCNSRGELSFNYLLVMLPSYVIDYVIIHELCHLQHLNHSKDFWKLVAMHFPRFTEAKEWIKTNQAALLWRL